MINELFIQESAIFYKITHNEKGNYFVPKGIIDRIFAATGNRRVGNFLAKRVKVSEANSSHPIYYSLCVFRVEGIPSFLTKTTSHRETHYAYLLIVEYDGYLAVSKKYILGFETMIENYAALVDHKIILNYRIGSDTSIERLNIKNTDQSNTSIKEKILEANDLTNSYSPVNSERQVVNNYRMRGNKGVMSISANTSRVSLPGRKAEHLAFFNRIIEEIDLIRNYRHKTNFLDHFAEPVIFRKEIKIATPIGVFISAHELFELTKPDKIVECNYVDSSGTKNVISFDILLGLFNYSFTLKKNGNYYDLSTTNENYKTLPVVHQELLNGISIGELKTKYQLRSRNLNRVTLTIDHEDIGNFLSLLNEKNLVNVNFDPPELMYRSGQLYRERDFYKRAELALSVIHSFKGLEATTSEKFPDEGATKELNTFDAKSIFNWIENNDFKKEADILICDDLGNEWADYITISKGNCVRFLHAKDGDKSLGASNFHIVISQALKNIGNMRAYAQLKEKSKSWNRKYKDTIIPMIRKPNVRNQAEFDQVITNYYDTLIDPNTVFESWIVVNFLSKKEITELIEKIKKRQKLPFYVLQLIGLILRYISSCQDANVRPFIACCE